MRDAAQGLAHLHSLRPPIVHGDIKPDNIMVTNDIKGALCDFGISRVMTSLGMHTGLTTAGQSAGTAGYQAKELYEEDSRPTPMSDVYAFGGVILAVSSARCTGGQLAYTIFWQTMSGKAPFHKKVGKAAAAIVLAINMNQTANPSDHTKLPPSDPLWAFLKKCWDAKPDLRPSTNEIIAEVCFLRNQLLPNSLTRVFPPLARRRNPASVCRTTTSALSNDADYRLKRECIA